MSCRTAPRWSLTVCSSIPDSSFPATTSPESYNPIRMISGSAYGEYWHFLRYISRLAHYPLLPFPYTILPDRNNSSASADAAIRWYIHHWPGFLFSGQPEIQSADPDGCISVFSYTKGILRRHLLFYHLCKRHIGRMPKPKPENRIPFLRQIVGHDWSAPSGERWSVFAWYLHVRLHP